MESGLTARKTESQAFLPGLGWLPWQSTWGQRSMIGLGAGLLSAYLAILVGPENGGVVFGFAISAISLTPLGFGLKVPVTHHIALTAIVAATASGSLLWGAIFGVAAALLGEFWADTFLVHGDIHIDPPATTIATLTTVSLILSALGVYAVQLP